MAKAGNWTAVKAALTRRFGAAAERLTDAVAGEPPALWQALASRGSVRAFRDPPPTAEELHMIAALALAAPTKSDLQQRDIVLVTEPDQRDALAALVSEQAWTAGAPAFAVICANHRRQRLIHELRGREFVNDHLDAFFNASVDAGIVLAAFVLAAEAYGFGVCPISAIRNRAQEASDLLGLPDHVFPVAALAVGRPAEEPEISLRLPLNATIHDGRFDDTGQRQAITAYDARRAAEQPYARQRRARELGEAEPYTWSEDKARQYNLPERADFGAFIRAKGFKLD
ncbi:nitroreductase family protein [Dichotomicrobium thermohalophilum]|uniref:Nitroreductase/FMN reductase (NADPH)/FMN reductase [NAD(P)H] n=1 Tax=Dichotomicrobium thermohalophilum TaxID=933063 RepID=A0A397Q3R8_9HYPH|nr:nitroreductase family protein [Dichotomicrobium thermohalophilum]RIA56170.1 nitroreductase/FMN reductase (NADPH)/FMN reductase [NAD(P)H] [Dichotomicrobium thermohalophilum]